MNPLQELTVMSSRLLSLIRSQGIEPSGSVLVDRLADEFIEAMNGRPLLELMVYIYVGMVALKSQLEDNAIQQISTMGDEVIWKN